jgi:hypothetical protein
MMGYESMLSFKANQSWQKSGGEDIRMRDLHNIADSDPVPKS